VARRKAYRALNGDLTFEQRQHLDRLLELRGESRQTWLEWLRQAIGAANPNNILSCIERLTFILQLHIPIEWARRIHQNRLVQIAPPKSQATSTSEPTASGQICLLVYNFLQMEELAQEDR